MTTRFVNSSIGKAGLGGVPAASAYTNPSRPARRIADALRVAGAGDTIVVQNEASYAEGELVLNKPVTLVSARALSSSPPKPSSDSYKPGSLPRILPARPRANRVVRIQFGNDVKAGRVVVRGFEITGGMASNRPGDPAWGAGGGIAIVDVSDLLIQDCYIFNNQTKGVPLGTITTVPFKDIVVRRLGEALALLSFINPGTIEPICADLRNELDHRMPNTRPNSLLTGQCFGGGVCFAWSSGRIESCKVVNNHANGRGSGIAVVGYGWPSIVDCVVLKNTSGTQPFARRDGGGIGAEISIPEKLGRDLSEGVLLKALTDWLSKVSTVTLAELLAKAALGTIVEAIRRKQWDGLLNVILYRFVRAYLDSEKWSSWNQADIDAAGKRAVLVSGCRIEENEASDDGGGIYCSVRSRIRVESSSVQKNNARGGAGGGIRTSMGSDLALAETVVAKNFSGGAKLGGGGVAARNCAIEVTGKSGTPTRIRENKSSPWAGGGLFLEATSEGAMAGVDDMWHAILLVVFGFSSMRVSIDEYCTVTANTAGTPRSRSAACHGKGGGLYIIRGAINDVADLHVEIAQFERNVTGNTGYSRSLLNMSPVGDCSKVTKITDQIALVDLANKVDDGDIDVRKHLGRSLRHPLAASTSFLYDS